jgi:hypothetical protein
MREKLIELLTEYYGVDPAYYGIEARHLADHLIANGVTIQKWIPVTERLPKEEWEQFTAENYDWDVFPCLAVNKNNYGGKQYVAKMFYTGENFVDDEYVRYTNSVTHWMPLPEAPKGE